MEKFKCKEKVMTMTVIQKESLKKYKEKGNEEK